VERMRRLAERGGDWADADTYVTPRTFDVARHAAIRQDGRQSIRRSRARSRPSLRRRAEGWYRLVMEPVDVPTDA
jgi:hypothetical protein